MSNERQPQTEVTMADIRLIVVRAATYALHNAAKSHTPQERRFYLGLAARADAIERAIDEYLCWAETY